MSEDFGKAVMRTQQDGATPKQIDAAYPDHSHLSNPNYNRLLKDYFACTTKYLNDFYDPVVLEQQLIRRDLDTVCAYELYQMKKQFTTTNVLNMTNFVAKQ